MQRRFDPIIVLAIGSVCLLVTLTVLLSRGGRPPFDLVGEPPLVMYCAAALKPAAESTAEAYEKETGSRVEFHFGNSEQVLAAAAIAKTGDLLLPADDSFIRSAQDQGLVASVVPLARMKLVVLTQPNNPHRIAKFADLLDPKLKFGQANPDAAAVGKVTRGHLRAKGLWDKLAANTLVFHTTVTDAANAVRVGSNDAAIVWDVVAFQYVGQNHADLGVVELPELAGAVGRVQLAILNSASRPRAERFARYLTASDRGQTFFRQEGFTDLEQGNAWTHAEITP